jgi:MarR-like DNA-binding transcriptional regulator SgrR of sgrS sRNA
VGEEGLPQPRLVTGWASAAQGRQWTLRLGDGLLFHDGQSITAEAVVRSLRGFLREEASSAAGAFARLLDGGADFRSGRSEALPGLVADDGHVVLRLLRRHNRPFAPLASPAAGIVSDTGAGCGPFVPTAPRAGGMGLQLSVFQTHWGGRAFLDSLLFRFDSPAALAAERQAGRIDVAPGSGSAPHVATLLLQLDPRHPVLAAEHARRAIANSIDREGLSRFVPGSDPSAPLLPPRLAPPLARPNTGSGGARFAGRLDFAVDRAVPAAASQRVVAHLSALGFEVQVRPVPSHAVWKSPGDVRLILWVPEVAEAELALRELAAHTLTPEGFDALLDAASTEADEDLRRSLLHRAEQDLAGRHELVPLLGMSVAFTSGPGVHGLRVGFGGALRLEDAWTER